MKNDVILYEKIYENLKYKIECGLLPGGYRLPSRANMCKEYETSEKPVRIALEMLVRDGFIETNQRKRPTVAYHHNVVHKSAECALRRAAAAAANDALKTSVLLCYPVIGYGLSLCRKEDFMIPQTIIEHMDPEQPAKFWKLSDRFWRFFVARTGNEFILRTVNSMGYSELDALSGSYEIRSRYLSTLKEFLLTVSEGGDPAAVRFEDMSFVYGFNGSSDKDSPTYQVPPDSVFLLGAEQLEKKIRKGEERYSNVYLDIIGLIETGCYKKGDRLPSHKELQKIYGVSIDTTLKAVKILKEWGVVKAAPNKGIWVAMGLDDLKRIPADSKLMACHIRRFLDSLELITLIIEGVAVHAMKHVNQEEIRQLRTDMESQWNDPLLFHFFPSTLLRFITEHIQYEMLRTIYEILQTNFRIGRSIPKFIGREKTEMDYDNFKKSIDAVDHLADGDIRCFARQTAELFQDIRGQIIMSYKKSDFWEAAMQVYDGTLLWK